MFKGSYVALVTPFHNGTIDEDSLQSLVSFHLENKTHGIVACGTTGESATLTHPEHDRVIELVVKYVGGRIPVIAGCGSNSTAEAIERTKFAKEIGADGALLVAPYYNKPTQEGLYQHFKSVADSSDIPNILYNVPGRTVTEIAPETVSRLSEIPNIVGIKEATGNLTNCCEIISKVPDDFLVLSGDDFVTLPMMAMGAVGTISVTANVSPLDVSNMCEAQLNGDFNVAKELHYKMWLLNKMMFIETNPIPAKFTLSLMGKVQPEFRLPLCSPSKENIQKLEEFASSYKLI